MVLCFSALNNKLASGRVELVVMENDKLGYRLDGADPVPFFSGKYLYIFNYPSTNGYNFIYALLVNKGAIVKYQQYSYYNNPNVDDIYNLGICNVHNSGGAEGRWILTALQTIRYIDINGNQGTLNRGDTLQWGNGDIASFSFLL